jgi:hypothetical protein
VGGASPGGVGGGGVWRGKGEEWDREGWPEL